MSKVLEELKLLENSQLLCYFVISRDNLISIKRALTDDKENIDLQIMFDTEQERYESYLIELYRRMNNGYRRR